MASMWKPSGICPACGAPGQSVAALKSLSRSCSLICGTCETPLYSDISWGRYLLFVLYGQIVAVILGVLTAAFLLSGRWPLAALTLIAMAALLILPAMALHAREIRTRFDL